MIERPPPPSCGRATRKKPSSPSKPTNFEGLFCSAAAKAGLSRESVPPSRNANDRRQLKSFPFFPSQPEIPASSAQFDTITKSRDEGTPFQGTDYVAQNILHD